MEKKYAQIRPRHRWTAHDSVLLKHASAFLGGGRGYGNVDPWCFAALFFISSPQPRYSSCHHCHTPLFLSLRCKSKE